MTINASDRQTFVEAVEKYYTDGELDQPRNANIKKLYNAIKSVDAIATSLDEKMNSFVTQKEDGTYDVKYDEGIKFFDSYKVDTDIEKGLMEYYKFMLAYYANKDSKTALGFIDNAYKKSGEYGYLYLQNYMGMAWQYKEYDKVLELSKIATELNVNDASAYYYAVKVYIEKNDFDTADKMCEEMRKANPDGIDYYSTKAEVLRRQNKLDEAIEICRKGIVAGSDLKFTVSRLLHISSRATRRMRSKQSSSRMKLQLKTSSFQSRRQTLLLLSASSATIQRRMKRLKRCSSRAVWN